MEIHQINTRFPGRISEIATYEKEIGSSFFPYGKVPDRYFKKPSIVDIVKYVTMKYERGDLFEDDAGATSCMSYYGLCESL